MSKITSSILASFVVLNAILVFGLNGFGKGSWSSKRVGKFNESFRWHLDNEWLGRLSETKSRRLHLIESNAQRDRPELQKLVDFSLGFSKIGRHTLRTPLIKRTIHSVSGTSQILNDKSKFEDSQREYDLLNKKFGRIPW